ncbi:MoaD/ThiS family protein [Kingella oralis]|uniref:MoaD/ThiS family protein n=1 Tax=Kingella oralis TaxID=505 RepID=UPI002D7E17EE|nr:MoaD/ThiS family protein [Kingella oralis]
MKNITLLYFAALREATGKDQETCATAAHTVAELYAELQQRYPLPAVPLRAARNHVFCDWHEALVDQDTIAFIPPVAGG